MLNDDEQLGQFLEMNGLLSAAQVAHFRRQADEECQALYLTVMLEGAVEESRLVAMMSQLLGIPSVLLKDFDGSDEVLRYVPAELIRRRGVLPVGVSAEDGTERLYVAMANPQDDDTLRLLAEGVSMPVVALLAGPNDLLAAIRRCVGTPDHPPGNSQFEDLDEALIVEDEEVLDDGKQLLPPGSLETPTADELAFDFSIGPFEDALQTNDAAVSYAPAASLDIEMLSESGLRGPNRSSPGNASGTSGLGFSSAAKPLPFTDPSGLFDEPTPISFDDIMGEVRNSNASGIRSALSVLDDLPADRHEQATPASGLQSLAERPSPSVLPRSQGVPLSAHETSNLGFAESNLGRTGMGVATRSPSGSFERIVTATGSNEGVRQHSAFRATTPEPTAPKTPAPTPSATNGVSLASVVGHPDTPSPNLQGEWTKAPVALLVRALVHRLVARGLLTEDELIAELRRLKSGPV